jgi:uncharacterized protein (TIGR02646 family)
MIEVRQGAKPRELEQDSARWLDEFRDAQLTASQFWAKVTGRKAMKNYVQQLHQACHHKCAFCESKPKATSSLQVEHYRPKGNPEFEALMFEWENWLSSCASCNSQKWQHFPFCHGEPCLINPSIENPTKHISFQRETVLHKTCRGKKTIQLIGLDRSSLEADRAKWLLQIDTLLLLLLRDQATRTMARELLIWAMQPYAPYSAMTYHYLSEKTPKLANPKKPHPHIKVDDPFKRIVELVESNKESLMNLT